MRHPKIAAQLVLSALTLSLLMAVPAGAANVVTPCTVTRLSPILYTAIDGHTETLTPWQGPKVAVLVEPGVTRSAAVMTKMVCALNRAYTYYQNTVGRSPAPAKTLNGRDTVAEVTTTCGAGCTDIGATGTELQTTTFENFYNEIACCNQYVIHLYEFGRSFWFWSSQLQLPSPCTDPVVTGFAVWMRFRSMSAAGVTGAPFPGPGGTPFSTFKAQVQGLEGTYDNNTSDSFAGTLCADQSPGMYSGTDFWASIMMKLASLYGGQKFTRLFGTICRRFRRRHQCPVPLPTGLAKPTMHHASTSVRCSTSDGHSHSLMELLLILALWRVPFHSRLGIAERVMQVPSVRMRDRTCRVECAIGVIPPWPCCWEITRAGCSDPRNPCGPIARAS